MSWFVYLVACQDGSLYAGVSNDVERRVATHNAGRGARYTRARRPVRLVYLAEQEDQREALRQERALKSLSRAQKRALAAFLDEGAPEAGALSPRPRP